MTPAGIEPATFRFVAHHLNHCVSLFLKVFFFQIHIYDTCNVPLDHVILTPLSRVLLEKLTGLTLVKKFPAFYVAQTFITEVKSARHLSLSRARSNQSTTPHPTSWSSILLLSSHLPRGLPSGLFASRFPTNTPYTAILPPIRATCPVHLILLDFITRTLLSEDYNLLSSSLYRV